MSTMAETETSLGRPVQIYSRQDGLLVDAFRNVVQTVSETSCVVVSVNGNRRTGKSFLLNLCVGHLDRKSSAHCSDADEYDFQSALTTSGFEWRGGEDSVTDGIWIWSRPFVLKKEGHPDVAFLLMDTEGAFDARSGFNDDARMFAISALFSSVFVYNVQGTLDEGIVTFLSKFIQQSGGQAVVSSSDESGKLFKSFVFLMRDWQSPKKYRLGAHGYSIQDGGEQFRYEPVEGNFVRDNFLCCRDGTTTEAVCMRKKIVDSCERISAFLMPYPGCEVATNEDGDPVSKMAPRFESGLRDLFRHLFHLESVDQTRCPTGSNLLSAITNLHKQPLDVATVCRVGSDAKFFTATTLLDNEMNSLLESFKGEILNFSTSREDVAANEAFKQFAYSLIQKYVRVFHKNTEKYGNPDATYRMMSELVLNLAVICANFEIIIQRIPPLIELNESYDRLDGEMQEASDKMTRICETIANLQAKLKEHSSDESNESIEKKLRISIEELDTELKELTKLEQQMDEFNEKNRLKLLGDQVFVSLAVAGLVERDEHDMIAQLKVILTQNDNIVAMLQEVAKEVDVHELKVKKGRRLAAATLTTSTVLGIVGLAIIPVTAGLGPVITSGLSMAVGAAGDVTNCGVGFSDLKWTSDTFGRIAETAEAKNKTLGEIQAKVENMMDSLERRQLPFVRALGMYANGKTGGQPVSKVNLATNFASAAWKATNGAYSAIRGVRDVIKLTSTTGVSAATEATTMATRLTARVAFSIVGVVLGAAVNGYALYRLVRDRNREHPVGEAVRLMQKTLLLETEAYCEIFRQYEKRMSEAGVAGLVQHAGEASATGNGSDAAKNCEKYLESQHQLEVDFGVASDMKEYDENNITQYRFGDVSDRMGIDCSVASDNQHFETIEDFMSFEGMA